MKKYFSIFILLSISAALSSQTIGKQRFRPNDRFPDKLITTDIHGDLHYDDGVMQASLTKDIFGSKIYKDDNGNEATYTKEVWNDAFTDYNGNDRRVLSWLVDSFYSSKNMKEKYEQNIHGDLEYERNDFKASLSKNIFDDGIYKDNHLNEIKYSKEFWADIVNDFEGNKMQIFFWLIDVSAEKNNYKEEFKVDIFGNQQYSNNKRMKASLSKDIFDVIKYEDSEGNKIEFSKNRWRKMTGHYGSRNSVFVFLLHQYLFEK